MPSLRKKKGNYYARFYDKRRSPKRTEIALGTSRKSAAEKWLRRMEDKWAKGTYDPWTDEWAGENSSLSGVINQFLKEKERAGVREVTLSNYECKLHDFARHAPAGAMMRDVGPDHIRSYMHARVSQGKANESDPSNGTVRQRHTIVKMLFSWAEENNFVESNGYD